MSNVKRVGSVIGLVPEARAEYERIHAAVWPTVLDRIYQSNIRNYSIYRHNDLLFSYYEYVGDNYEADIAKMGEDPETQRWWELTIPMQNALDDRAPGEWWKTLPEVFHTN